MIWKKLTTHRHPNRDSASFLSVNSARGRTDGRISDRDSGELTVKCSLKILKNNFSNVETRYEFSILDRVNRMRIMQRDVERQVYRLGRYRASIIFYVFWIRITVEHEVILWNWIRSVQDWTIWNRLDKNTVSYVLRHWKVSRNIWIHFIQMGYFEDCQSDWPKRLAESVHVRPHLVSNPVSY